MAMLGTLTTAYKDARATTPRKTRTSLLVRAGRAAARLTPSWQNLRTVAMSTGAFGAMDAGLWELPAPLNRILGLIGIGAALLILEALTGSDA